MDVCGQGNEDWHKIVKPKLCECAVATSIFRCGKDVFEVINAESDVTSHRAQQGSRQMQAPMQSLVKVSTAEDTVEHPLSDMVSPSPSGESRHRATTSPVEKWKQTAVAPRLRPRAASVGYLRCILGGADDKSVMPLPMQSSHSDNGAKSDSQPDATATDKSSSSHESVPLDGLPIKDADEQFSTQANDTFLNASIQLSHMHSNVRQSIRQLWFTVQRLRWENQITDVGVNTLHKELQAIMKATSLEKSDGSKFVKTGYLKLIQAPVSATAALKQQSMKALLGGKQPAQLVWCALSEDAAKFDMIPVKEPAVVAQTAQTLPPAAKLGLANSLMGMLSDALQPDASRKTIKLLGCHVRTISAVGDHSQDMPARFQILVPCSDNRSGNSPNRSTAYDIYVFEAAPSSLLEGSEPAGTPTCIDSWSRAISGVCMSHLIQHEESIRSVNTAVAYRDVLSRSFPLSIPLTWLRNRQERGDLNGHQDLLSLAQHQSTKNLTMVQIMKDLERDQVLLDGRLICPMTSSSTGDGSVDAVAEIFKHIVMKATAASYQNGPLSPDRRQSTTPPSPTKRLAVNHEAMAVALVERVLRGCSRTQSGGDIYDAISYFCQHERVSICPVSQEAHPVQIDIVEGVDQNELQVEVKVCMRFKVVELTPLTPPAHETCNEPGAWEARMFDDEAVKTTSVSQDSHHEWATVEGTLVRRFTMGKASTPGSVSIALVRSE